MILPFRPIGPAAPEPALRRVAERRQRTLAKPATLQGPGFITGRMVRVEMHPAAEDSGIVFERTDAAFPVRIPARADRVTGTARRTTLGEEPNSITLVEHLLAALAGLRVDNCVVRLDGPEPAGLDGSAMGFVDAIHEAGIIPQAARRDVWTVTRPVTLSDGTARLTIYPGENRGLRIDYRVDYGPGSPISPHSFNSEITPQAFANDLAPCRTFVLESEAKELRRHGVGLHLTERDLLVFGPRGPIGNEARFPNEPARHKALDIVGDLALTGFDIAGDIVAFRSGHSLNVELARKLFALREAALIKEFRKAA